MSTTEKPDPESIEASAGAPRSPQPPPPPSGVYFKVDVALRGLLFAATTVALFVMATAEQTKGIIVPGVNVTVRNLTKFDQSPALIYFVSALTVASLYSLLTTITSIGVILNPHLAMKFLLHFAFWDVLMLGIVSAATGTAGGVAYIALKGNSHLGWVKICNTYDKFCQHIAASLAFSLFASVLLVLLVMLSALSLHSKIR